MKVLVVGGTGFLGQHVVAELLARGHQVTAVARGHGPALPNPATMITGDVQRFTGRDLAALLAGHDAVVFAAGADDRVAPRRPAAPYFHEANVAAVARLLTAAREAGASRAVVLGSYFTACARTRPELELARRHVYIRSRIEQASAARQAAGPDLPVAVLEIPFVFGSAPGRRPLWAPAVPWLRRARVPLAAPPGGTAVVTARSVGKAAVAALERAAGGNYPVAEENLSWAELLRRFAAAAGRPAPIRVGALAPVVLRAALGAAGLSLRLQRKEPGLDPAHAATLFTSELFVDLAPCRDELGVTENTMDQALRETVAASLETSR